MDRVVVTKEIHGIVSMQVCAAADATDQEILATCNKQNPSGTSNGWCVVERDDTAEGRRPVACAQNPQRLHFLVTC